MADLETIRDVWRALARAHHPDVVGGCPDAASRRFSEINEAYDILRSHLTRTSVERDDLDMSLRAKYAARRDVARRRAMAEQKRRMDAARRTEAEFQAEASAHERTNATQENGSHKAKPKSNPRATTQPETTVMKRPTMSAEGIAALRGYLEARKTRDLPRSYVDLAT
ncbi:MAG: J domain-containing protein [Marinovum sp.]|nr:J domain-containing protein [Marinovum sp.]